MHGTDYTMEIYIQPFDSSMLFIVSHGLSFGIFPLETFFFYDLQQTSRKSFRGTIGKARVASHSCYFYLFTAAKIHPYRLTIYTFTMYIVLFNMIISCWITSCIIEETVNKPKAP